MHDDGGFDGIEGRTATREDAITGIEGTANTGFVRGRGVWRDGPGSSVHKQSGYVGG